MKRTTYSLGLACLGLFVVLAAGCGLFNGGEKPYRGCFWPADVELADKADLSEREMALASGFCDVDRRLEDLISRLKSREREPAPEWMEQIARSFSWVNGLVYTEVSGEVLRRYPQQPIKTIDPAELLAGLNPEDADRVRYRVQDHPLGDEFALIKPLAKGLKTEGYLIAHFDLRSLLRFTSQPEQIALLNGEKVLWPGALSESSRLGALDWREMLRDRVRDTIEINGKRYYWLARFVGRDPLIYVVEIPQES